MKWTLSGLCGAWTLKLNREEHVMRIGLVLGLMVAIFSTSSWPAMASSHRGGIHKIKPLPGLKPLKPLKGVKALKPLRPIRPVKPL